MTRSAASPVPGVDLPGFPRKIYTFSARWIVHWVFPLVAPPPHLWGNFPKGMDLETAVRRTKEGVVIQALRREMEGLWYCGEFGREA